MHLIKKTCSVHIMASGSKGAAQNWLKFHPNKMLNSVQPYEYLARLGNSGKCKLRCKVAQLWGEHSQLQNLYKGLSFDKVLPMVKDWVFLDKCALKLPQHWYNARLLLMLELPVRGRVLSPVQLLAVASYSYYISFYVASNSSMLLSKYLWRHAWCLGSQQCGYIRPGKLIYSLSLLPTWNYKNLAIISFYY